MEVNESEDVYIAVFLDKSQEGNHTPRTKPTQGIVCT